MLTSVDVSAIVLHIAPLKLTKQQQQQQQQKTCINDIWTTCDGPNRLQQTHSLTKPWLVKFNGPITKAVAIPREEESLKWFVRKSVLTSEAGEPLNGHTWQCRCVEFHGYQEIVVQAGRERHIWWYLSIYLPIMQIIKEVM